MQCPACEAENRESARFCDACGEPLLRPVPAAVVYGEPAPSQEAPAVVRIDRAPPPVPSHELPPSAPNELPPTHPEWKMSPAGPLPDPPKRRIWLWIVGALLFCVAMFILMNVMLVGLAPPVSGS